MKAVIFDMDGVLTDSEPIINAAAIAMFKEYGIAAQPIDFEPFIGAGENRYVGGVAQQYGLQVDVATLKARTYEIYLDIVREMLKAFPGAVELVKSCRAAGYLTAVASSADWIKVEANLLGIDLPPSGFDAVITAEKVEHKKPSPEIFLAAARELGVAPSDCTVVEDAVNGVDAALAAKMRCVAIASSFPAAKLSHAHAVRPTIAEVTLDDLRG